MAYAKYFMIGAMFLVVSASQSFAGFSLPHYVHTMKQLEAAQGKATASKKPLTFVYTNKDTK